MASKRNSQPPLIVEQHPKEYDGYPFITLIQFKTEHILCIVDNADETTINAYVLDLCGPTQTSEEDIINVAAEWFSRASSYPLSIEFSKRGMSEQTQHLYKTFHTEFVTRVIGPLPSYPMLSVSKVKRRRKKPISPTIEVKQKVIKIF